jgi:LacI family transcriptional regulator
MDRKQNFSKKNRPVTILDVARESGVSYATVSRVLSGYTFVKETTRSRVMAAVTRLGYVANLQARSLAGGHSQIIGLLVPNLDNGYIGAIMRGIDQELLRANYDLMLYTTHRHPGKESNYVNTIANGLTEGLLLVAPLVPADYLKALRDQVFPYVLIDQADPENESSVVDSTSWQGAYDAISYLAQLGHRRIGFITGLLTLNSAIERLEGYKAALSDAGLPFDAELVREGDYWEQPAYQATQALLQDTNPPTAIFASNDLSAFGVMDAVRDAGLRIPDDISIVGFDDTPQASGVYPKLTTVRQPLDQMGRVAVKMLLEQIAEPDRPLRHVTLATQLIVRDSCAAPHK